MGVKNNFVQIKIIYKGIFVIAWMYIKFSDFFKIFNVIFLIFLIILLFQISTSNSHCEIYWDYVFVYFHIFRQSKKNKIYYEKLKDYEQTPTSSRKVEKGRNKEWGTDDDRSCWKPHAECQPKNKPTAASTTKGFT